MVLAWVLTVPAAAGIAFGMYWLTQLPTALSWLGVGIVLIVSLLFTDLSIAHPLVMLLSVILAAVLFSLAGFVNAVYAKKFDDISIIPTASRPP